MKKFAALLLTLAMALSLAACGAKKEEAPAEAAEAPAEERRQIRVGMECAYAPNNWQEDTATDLNVPIENLPGFYALDDAKALHRHRALAVQFHQVQSHLKFLQNYLLNLFLESV